MLVKQLMNFEVALSERWLFEWWQADAKLLCVWFVYSRYSVWFFLSAGGRKIAPVDFSKYLACYKPIYLTEPSAALCLVKEWNQDSLDPCLSWPIKWFWEVIIEEFHYFSLHLTMIERHCDTVFLSLISASFWKPKQCILLHETPFTRQCETSDILLF